MDDHEYDADFEGSQAMRNSNTAILQGFDLSVYEESEDWGYTWDPNAVESSNGSGFGIFDLPDRPATAGSVYEDALEELPNCLVTPSIFSPAALNDEDHY
jgi:hypothetical protein